MAKLQIKRGTTSILQKVVISTTSGTGLTGLTSATSGLTAYYIRDGDNATTAITLSAGTLGTWSSGGFVEVDATHMPGAYELGIPNAALSGTGRGVVIWLRGASGMADCPLEIEIDSVDNQDAAAYGLSRVDATISSRLAASADPTSALAAISTGQSTINTNVLSRLAASADPTTALTAIKAKTDQLGFTGGSVNAYSTNVLASGAIISISPSSSGVTLTNLPTQGPLLEVTRGTKYPIGFARVDNAGNALPLTGCKIEFLVKANLTDADTAALLTKNTVTAGGITITDSANGLYTVTITPADTDDTNGPSPFTTGAYYYWGCKLWDAGNNPLAQAWGRFQVVLFPVRTITAPS